MLWLAKDSLFGLHVTAGAGVAVVFLLSVDGVGAGHAPAARNIDHGAEAPAGFRTPCAALEGPLFHGGAYIGSFS